MNRRLSRRHGISVALLCGYWALPGDWLLVGDEQQLLHPIDVFIILALLFLFCLLPRPTEASKPHLWTLFGLSTLLSLKLLWFWLVPAQGLAVISYANPDWQGTPEKGWRLSPVDEDISRLAPGLNYVDHGFSIRKQTFPLHFVNDSRRFNWYGNETQYLRRKQFLFSAKWEGFVKLDEPSRKLILTVKGGHGFIQVGQDRPPVKVESNGRAVVTVEQGIHPIEVGYSHDSPGERKLFLGWWDDDSFTPVAASALASWKEQLESPIPTGATTWLMNLVWLCFLLVTCGRQIRATGLRVSRASPLILISIYAFLAYVALAGLTDLGKDSGSQILPAGGDPFVYETQARAILFGDFLNTSLTGNTTFYFNVLYRYLLAALHLLFGEDILLVVWAQQLLMLAFFAFFYEVVRRICGAPIALVAVVLIFAANKLTRFPEELLDTTFSVWMAFLLSLSLLAYARRTTYLYSIAVGVCLGLTITLRANYLPFALLALLWIFVSTPSPLKRKLAHVLVCTTFLALPLLMTSVRNQVVAGSFTFIPRSGPVNLWLGNHPAKGEGDAPWDDIPPPERERVRAALTYIWDEPGAFIRRVQVKFLFLLGFDREHEKTDLMILVPHLLALIGAFFAWGKPHWRDWACWLGSWICLNYALLCLVFPGYDWRLSASTMPMLYVFAAAAIVGLVQRTWVSRARSA